MAALRAGSPRRRLRGALGNRRGRNWEHELMRILQIDTGREMRGGQWQALRLMEGLRAAGVETWLAARAGSPVAERAAERGLRVEPLGMGALREPADLLHAHDARAHALAAVCGRGPLVVARRVAFPISTGMVSRWKYGRAAHFIAVSEYVRAGLMERGIAAERISVVYDGVPPADAVEGGRTILAPPPSKDKPEELYQLSGVNIVFARNLEADLRNAAMFVYLSRSEGLGSGILMAMAAGVPVIASRVGGIPEIIRHEENGLLVDGPDSAVAAINRLQCDPALGKILAVRARRNVAEMFSIDNMIHKTLSVYHRVLSC
jgi:hypothetical protein